MTKLQPPGGATENLVSVASVAQGNARQQPAGALPLKEKMAVRHLDFFYRGNQALRDVSMVFYDKAVTALIGPSGCGKSTLLRVLNRIYALYDDQRVAGEVLLDGMNVLDPSLDITWLRRRVGMVFQKPTPFPLSIYENIAFGIRLYESLPHEALDERVEQALQRAGLWDEVKDILHQSGLSLSGGQQQRLCIARAVAVNPEVVLLDEPASALDPLSTSRVEDLIQELRNDYCVIVVTHNMQQAARISDRTAFMYLGELIEVDATEAIFTRPRRRETEAYVTGRFG